MKKCYQPKGIVTLGILLLLSSLLLILLSLDDETLSFHRFISWQYRHSIHQHLQLQQRVMKESDIKCETLRINQAEDFYLLTFQERGIKEPLKYQIWCERKKLFKQQPTKSKYIRKLSSYINLDVLNILKPQLLTTSKLTQSNTFPKLYFLEKDQNSIHIEGNHNVVILAIGDLYLTGNGRLYGSVLTKGDLHIANTVKLIYKKNVVTRLMHKYRFWQKAERSLYDHN